MEPAKEWRLYDAKNKFSEVVNLALTVGPQHIRRNKDEVVLLSKEAFDALSQPPSNFVDFLFTLPCLDDVNIERDSSLGRECSF